MNAELLILLHNLTEIMPKVTPGRWGVARNITKGAGVQAPVKLANGDITMNTLCKMTIAKWRTQEQMLTDAVYVSLVAPYNVKKLLDAIGDPENNAQLQEENNLLNAQLRDILSMRNPKKFTPDDLNKYLTRARRAAEETTTPGGFTKEDFFEVVDMHKLALMLQRLQKYEKLHGKLTGEQE